jgi:hypothetical protein
MATRKLINRYGLLREWKHVPEYTPDGSHVPKINCYDCDENYGSWPDMSLPAHVWELISPSVFAGCGLLCPSCIVHRLSYIGMHKIVETIGCYSGQNSTRP